MTPKERAWEVCKWLDAEIGLRIEAEEKGAPLGQLDYRAIRERIEQAILSEREACAQIAGEVRAQRQTFDSSGAGIASLIETRIRTQTTGGTK